MTSADVAPQEAGGLLQVQNAVTAMTDAEVVAVLREANEALQHAEQLRLGSVPGAMVDQHICDSGAVPVRVDACGNPLDVGREQRLFTPRQRIALALGDGGCRWADATARPRTASPTTSTNGTATAAEPTSIEGSCSAASTTWNCITAAGASPGPEKPTSNFTTPGEECARCAHEECSRMRGATSIRHRSGSGRWSRRPCA
ncbi:hypothetical protein V2S04_02810 [Microbacterium sp. OR21]|uniref:hypothetical protein n=1 Tax=Microbacterium sp. OR21 TaxID=3095346 RepID=UPI0039B5A358